MKDPASLSSKNTCYTWLNEETDEKKKDSYQHKNKNVLFLQTIVCACFNEVVEGFITNYTQLLRS